jgi:hypothetical protein
MTHKVIVHLLNEDPIVAELERIPEPGDASVRIFDPRREDGKPIHYLKDSSTSVIFPMHRVSSLEIFAEERAPEEEITFYREEQS